MKKNHLSDFVRLQHILEAINYTETFLQGKNKEDFFDEPIIRFAIERQLEIIGEAANHLSENILLHSSNTDWRKIIAFRNFIVHEYFGVDLELVWDIVQTKLPALKVEIVSMISNIDEA
jgi:uncharacterized protein with HEPN domain